MSPAGRGEVLPQLRINLVEGGLRRPRQRSEDAPCAGGDGDGGALGEDEGLTPGGVEVRGENLRLGPRASDVAKEQLLRLESRPGCSAYGALGRLAYDDFEGLVLPEEDLLGVAVGTRVRQLPLETQEEPQPPLIAGRGDVGGNAHQVDGAVHRLPGTEEEALPQLVIGAPGGRQVDTEVWDG